MKYRKESCIQQKQLSDGTWSFRVLLKKGETRITKTFAEKDYGSSKKAFDEAILFRNKTHYELEANKYFKPTEKPLREVFDETFGVIPIREETKRKHILLFNKYFPDVSIAEVNSGIIIKSLNNMINDCSNDTIERCLSIWRRITKTAIVKGYIEKDSTIGVAAPKSLLIQKESKPCVTTREIVIEVESLCREHLRNGDKVADAIELMWFTGMRPAECFALSPSDLSYERVSINKELGSGVSLDAEIKESNINVIRQCKTKASTRSIPVTPQMLPLIKKLMCVSGDRLFDDNGNYFNISYLGQRIHRLKKDFNLYQLRHTLATDMVANRIDERTVIEILGHNNFGMSVYYARSDEERKKEALELRS